MTLFLSSLETMQLSGAEQATSDSKALIEVAKGMTAQAESFSQWLKLFQTTSAPTSSVVREEDEYAAQERRKFESNLPADLTVLPEEFQLQWVLAHDPNRLLE